MNILHRAFFHTVRKSLSFLILAALPMAAQTGLGVVRGTVTDSSKAVIPDAKVVLSNTATGVPDSTQTTPAGVYHFGAVRPGPYTLAVEVPHFKKWTGTLQLEVGQTAVIDISLEIGTVGSTVEVTGAAPVIETEGSQVSDVKDARRIHQLPLNGRYVTNLFLLTPGVEDNSPDSRGQAGGNPRVNGMKVGSTEMLLDGVSQVSRFGGGMVNVQPGLDTVQEYRIETAGSNAQYSRPATVALITKSGTNEIHGSAFETHRNNFGGLRARQRQDGAATPPQYIRNEFGASAGGPIVKNKTFWFASYEGQRQRQSRYYEAQVPTDAIWNGDFSSAVTSDYQPITIYDPLTTAAGGSRQPFAGNRIPQSRLAPIGPTMKSVSAMPTNLAADPWTDVNFKTYYANTYDYNTLTGKIDHVFSEKDNVSGRFTRSVAPSRLYGGRYGYPPPGSTDAGGTSRQDSAVHSVFGRWNHVFTPTLLNEFQASGNRAANSSGTLADSTNWADKLGLPNPFGVTGWPTIYTDSPFFYYGGWDSDNRKDQMLTAYQIEDNVTWIRGKHNVRFGFKGRQELNNVREMQQAQGSHWFGGEWTQLYDPASDQNTSFTGSGFASLLLGLPGELANQYNRGYFYFRQKEIGSYVQDTWRVSQRLTLDLGVRWDKWTVYKEKYNRLVNLDLSNYASGMQVITPANTTMESIPGVPASVLQSWALRGLTWKTASQAGFPSGLLPADNNNFGPRLGLAYRLTDKTVLRTGYGIYYWTMPLSQILQSSRTNPPLNLLFKNTLTNQNGRNYNYALKNAPAASDFIGQATVDTTGIAGIGQDAQDMMPWGIRNWADNMAQNWTFTIERELMRETALRLSYIGNHGSNLEQRWLWNSPESEWNYQARTGLPRPSNIDLRRVNPNWTGGTGVWGPTGSAAVLHNGYSNAHSLQAEVERRFTNGLGFQWFYSFTRAMNTTDADGASAGTGGINNIGKGDGSSSTFTVPQNLLLMGEPNLSDSELLRLGYANSSAVPAHRIRWNGIYDLPFGKGKKFGRDASRGVDLLIGGWQLSFNGSWRGGFWMGVNSNKYLFGDPTLSADERLEMNIFGKHQRLWFRGYFDPTRATGVDASKLQQLVPVDGLQRIYRPAGPNLDNRLPQTLADNTERYTPITDMVNWNARNFLRGPGAWNQDLSVFKNIPIGERFKVRLTADFFNVLNHPVDMAPDQNSGLQDLSRQANDPRIVQFSARVEW